MSHSDFQADFDPTTPVVETEGHIHVLIEWEDRDENGVSVSLKDAETEIQVNFVERDEEPVKNWESYGVFRHPTYDVQIPVKVDGFIETRQRQRVQGGEWSAWTVPVGTEVNLQPARKAQTPTVMVGENNGTHTAARVDLHWPDRDVQGNVIKPVQAEIEALLGGGDPEKDWVKLGVVNYPAHSGNIMIPNKNGPQTVQVRVRVMNLCRILNEPSDPAVFDVGGIKLASGGAQHIKKGCL